MCFLLCVFVCCWFVIVVVVLFGLCVVVLFLCCCLCVCGLCSVCFRKGNTRCVDFVQLLLFWRMLVDANSSMRENMYNCKEKHIFHENNLALYLLGCVCFLFVVLVFLVVVLLLFC